MACQPQGADMAGQQRHRTGGGCGEERWRADQERPLRSTFTGRYRPYLAELNKRGPENYIFKQLGWAPGLLPCCGSHRWRGGSALTGVAPQPPPRPPLPPSTRVIAHQSGFCPVLPFSGRFRPPRHNPGPRRSGPFVQDEEGAKSDEAKTGRMVPGKRLLEVGYGKDGEDQKSDDLLNGLEFSAGELGRADVVGRHLQYIFKEGDPPGNQDHGILGARP